MESIRKTGPSSVSTREIHPQGDPNSAYTQVHGGSPLPQTMTSLISSAMRSQLGTNAEFKQFKAELDALGKGSEADERIKNYLENYKDTQSDLSLIDFMSLMRRIDSIELKEGYALERMKVEPNMNLKTFQAFFSHLSSEGAEAKGLELLNNWQPLKTMDEALKRNTINTFLNNVDNLKHYGPDKSHSQNAGILNTLKDKAATNNLSLPIFLKEFGKLSHLYYKKEALDCLKNWEGFKNLLESQKISTLKVLLRKVQDTDIPVLGPYLVELMVEKAENEGTAVSQKEIVELVKGFLDRTGFTAAAYMNCEKHITLAHHQQAIQKHLFETCFPKWENAKIESFLIAMDLNDREHRAKYLQ